jgi:hypothetical protein
MSEISRKDRSRRRMGVLFNYAMLVLLLICFYVAEIIGWNIVLAAGSALSLAAVILSFIKVHIKTRLWHLGHARTDDLDERQVQITHESLRYSYIFFTIIALTVFLVADVYRQFSIVAAEITMTPIIAGLIYLAHTLPSSILAWTEREV